MSRGGRGGFGGGGRGGGGMGVMSGPMFGDDMKPDYSVTELFPPQPPPVQSGLTKEEREVVGRFRGFREGVHNGPMYTVMARKRGADDPFNDVGRYSARYMKQARRAPKLDARPYVAEFFPVELYPTLGIDDEGKSAEQKSLLLSALDRLEVLEGIEGEDEGGEEERKGVGAGEEEGNEGEEEEVQDDFEDDEEGDYDAEQYFSGGEGFSDDGGDEGDFF